MKTHLAQSALLYIFLAMAITGSTLASPCDDEYPFDPDWVVSGPTINIRDLGAIGDGVTNDSAAFREAAAQIEAAGSGKLVIPAGTYIVGQQTHIPGQYPYFQYQEIFQVLGVQGLIIEGEPGAIIKLADGLRFGCFDKDSGEVFYPPGEEGFTDSNYRADAGIFFNILESCDIIIRHLELDGNLENLVIGGYWGDANSRQCEAIGILMLNNSNVFIHDIYTHHHGLDGVEIGYYGQRESDPARPHVLERVRSEYNSRQGLSWIGGRGLTAIDCQFNHTSRAGFTSDPAAGLDIEAEGAVNRGGRFINCEFINNMGAGLVIDSGDSGDCCFENCTFWGTTSWAVWNDKPGMVFRDCNFYGSTVHAFGSTQYPEQATRYENCHFEDLVHPEHGVFRSEMLVEMDGIGGNVTFDGCDIVANELKSFWISTRMGTTTYLRDCTITHKNHFLEDGDWQCLLRQVSLENVHFREDLNQGFGREYWINVDNLLVGDGVIVDGPQVLLNGLSGSIEPGFYNPYFTPAEDIQALSKNDLSCYPNPFNPLTKILFSVREAGPVNVSVYDLRGGLVAVLVNEYQAAGEYEITWRGVDMHGRQQSTGKYTCRLVVGGHSTSTALILVK